MRPVPFAFALALALAFALTGCVSPVASDADDAPIAELPALPFHGEGRAYLPASQGSDRVETLLPFPVNATGMAIAIHAILASNYGPVDAPVTIANAIVELRAPDGAVLAEGDLGPGTTEAHLEAVANTTGEHMFAILSYGGSDGSANGDRIDYVIDAQ